MKIVHGAIFEKLAFLVPLPVFPGFEPVIVRLGDRRAIPHATGAKGFSAKKIILTIKLGIFRIVIK